MDRIGIVAICFDGYGRFIPRLIESIFSQNRKADEITIVAIGEHHCLEEIADDRVKVIYIKERVSMGEARNIGIEATKTDWILYFSADDILLPNALKEIEDQDNNDIVFLQLEKHIKNKIEKYETFLPDEDKIENWQVYYKIPGYVAFKKMIWGNNKYIDSDFPNLPFIFQNYKIGCKFGKTENVCAVYIKRRKGHSKMVQKKRRFNEAVNLIEQYV